MNENWVEQTLTKPFLIKAWEKAGFQQPTDVQQQTFSMIKAGSDCIVEAPTGTGKTLAYLLPLFEKVNQDVKNAQVLILASSHELVMQIHHEVQKWGEGSGISSATFIGGANVKRQLEKLKKKPQVIIGTPGRVEELINQKKLKMHEVKTVVLDEGDQLLVPEHQQTIKAIIKSTLNDRQVLFFSATLPPHMEAEASDLMKEPQVIKIKLDKEAMEKVEHIYFVCEQRDKIDILRRLVRMGSMKALAFFNDIENLSILAEKLQYKGVDLGVLHSEANKAERAEAIKKFRLGEYPLLIATDVAARGLDIQGLTHVIQLNVPEKETQYVHRAGRTGRAGATGTVISIVTEREEKYLIRIAKELNLRLQKKYLYKGEIVDKR